MTCPDRPHDLDLLLVGEPTAPEVASHAAECATCASEVALARRIDAALVSRRDVVAPASLVADALAEARRQRPLAAPRGPVALRGPAAQRSRRLRWVAGVAVLIVALASTWVALGGPEAETTTEIAEVTPEAAVTPPEPLAEEEPASDQEPASPQEPSDPAPTVDPAPEAAPSPGPAPRLAPAPRRTPRRSPRPSRALPSPAPSPEAAPDTAPDPLLAEAEPTPADIEQAEAELKLAFALIAGAQRQAGKAVRDEAGPLATTLDRTLPF